MKRSLPSLLWVVFLLTILGMSAWSWALVDPNLTLVKHADWSMFREAAVSLGYHNRPLSATIFILLILAMSIVSVLLVRTHRGRIFPLALAVGVIAGVLSYPALSHDIFNYIFDARILTHYHANPYLHSALDFPADPMLRFMHWVHRPYPYGPTFLMLSLVPSWLGGGIFGLTFFLFKIMNITLFVIAAWCIDRINHRASVIFVTSPLVIIEGLVNSHNDLIALALGIIGIYLVARRMRIGGLVAFVTSGLVKFLTLPSILLALPGKALSLRWNHRHREHRIEILSWHIVLISMMGLLVFLIWRQEIQPWYFLNLFLFVPFAPGIFDRFAIFFTGLLLSYHPYVLGGEWGQGGDVQSKHTIIVVSFVVNILYLLMRYWRYILRRL